MMTALERAKQLLITDEYICVLCRGEAIYTSSQRGVKPLVVWLESGRDFSGYSAADKVVGKATAFLYILLDVKAVYAHVISEAALRLLNDYAIAVECGTVVPNIINRQGKGICPFEAAVLGVDRAEEAYRAIRCKMEEMNISIVSET